MNSSRFPKGKFNAVIGKLYYQTSNKTVCLNVFLRYKETHVDLDAANDAHSGLVIFNRFSKMAKAMPSIPKPSYYSFDSINGRLFDSAGIAWSPSNPEYDPGPRLLLSHLDHLSRPLLRMEALTRHRLRHLSKSIDHPQSQKLL